MATGIYKYTNKINGNSYIGQSVKLNRRKIEHSTNYCNPLSKEYNSTIHQAFRKYGYENFDYEILEECTTDELDDREIYFIDLYDTYYNGYNNTKGGDNHPFTYWNEDLLNGLTSDLIKNELNYDDLAEKYNCSKRSIRALNSGEMWLRSELSYPLRPYKYNYNEKHFYCRICGIEIKTNSDYCLKCAKISQRKVKERPEPLELAKMVVENGFENIGKKYNVSGNTIKKWCKAYNIPYLKKELVEWYQKQIGSN